jgi:hypothetical protein
MKKRERWLCGAVFGAVLLLDLCWRSYFFNFDGVACAIAVELSDFKHLVHGNHLAYGVLAWLFDRAMRLLGYRGDALWSLQILDCVLGAAGAAVFASLLRRSGRSERESLLGAAALGVSQAWWFWSLEAQVYMLGAAFAALAAREALADEPRPALVGLWEAAAVLGHVGHVMAVPALAWLLARRRGAPARFAAALAAALVAAYAAAAVLAVGPLGFEDVRVWLLGSAALSVDRSFAWHAASPLQGAASWLLMTPRIFCEFTGLPGAIKGFGAALAALPLAAAAVGVRRGGRPARFWLLWLAGYAALYLTWEPFTVVYRISDLLGLWALAAIGLDALPPRARAAALAAWVAAAGAFNWATQILPHADPDANLDLASARWLAQAAPENAWVLVEGRDQVYVPYFAHRRPLNLRYLADDASLDGKLDALAALGETVLVTDRTVDESGRRAAFERYGLSTLAASEGRTLYRVRRSASRAEGSGTN